MYFLKGINIGSLLYIMGLVESTLKPQTVKPLIRSDLSLPSLTLDSCKFTDDSFGFIVTMTDLAKNSSVYTFSLKSLYSPIPNVYTYVGKNQAILSFSKNTFTGSVYCCMNLPNLPGPVIYDCVTVYEPIGDDQIDKLSTLFTK